MPYTPEDERLASDVLRHGLHHVKPTQREERGIST